MLKKVKKTEETKEVIKNKVKEFSLFKKARMVKITGNFMKGGFLVSQNKIKAIFDNEEVLKKFTSGEFNKEIDELKENEILEI